jgi:hypothetical protein
MSSIWKEEIFLTFKLTILHATDHKLLSVPFLRAGKFVIAYSICKVQAK